MKTTRPWQQKKMQAESAKSWEMVMKKKKASLRKLKLNGTVLLRWRKKIILKNIKLLAKLVGEDLVLWVKLKQGLLVLSEQQKKLKRML